MRSIHAALTFSLILVFIASSCATTGYWIPPSSPPTPAAPVVELPTQIPIKPQPTEPPPTPAPTDPPPPPTPTEPPLSPTTPPTVSLPPVSSQSTPTAEIEAVESSSILYYAQAADTLPVVAVRFGVEPDEITSTEPIPPTAFINPGQLLIIPRRLQDTTSSQQLIPDSEVVFSPSTIGFDANAFAREAGGYLSTKREWLKSSGVQTAADVIMRVAAENSINPRLLLSLLEYQSGWVYGQPSPQQIKYPIGYIDLNEEGLYKQLVWAVNQLSIGYYDYREGRMTEIRFPDGSSARLAPDLNAGSAALQYFFAQLYQGQRWQEAVDPENGFMALHRRMFGDPWERARTVEPLYPPGITQPPLILPFVKNWLWAYTGGPHGAWELDGAYAALDFAPGTMSSGCVETDTWAVASASGLVVRTGTGLVVIDLDGDGYEQTGWVLVYMHLETDERIQLGEWVATGDQLGHPSCEGGHSTGTHIHLARKFNGEWVPADGPLPFNLGGWIAHNGAAAYKGTLTRDGKTVTACTCSNAASFVTRTDEDP